MQFVNSLVLSWLASDQYRVGSKQNQNRGARCLLSIRAIEPATTIDVMDRTLWLSVRALVGLLFFQHGAEKLWGFAGGRTDHNFYTLHGIAGPLEAIGGALLAAGILTAPIAFLLCGEMAVAYFMTWAPRGFFPIANGGEESVLFCFLFLWMTTAGASSQADRSTVAAKLAVWEPQARSILRGILGFLFALHGLRLAFGILPPMAGRRLAAPMAMDQLGTAAGYFVLLFGILLALGLYLAHRRSGGIRDGIRVLSILCSSSRPMANSKRRH